MLGRLSGAGDKQLVAAINKATTPVKALDAATSTANDLEADPVAMLDIIQALQNDPKLIGDAVGHMKKRIKDEDSQVSFLALGVLDQCMEAIGFQFQAAVMKKVLDRVSKIAYGLEKAAANMVRNRAISLVQEWGQTYGGDPRLSKFQQAALEINRRVSNSIQGAMQAEAMRESEADATGEGEREGSPEQRALPQQAPPPQQPVQMSYDDMILGARSNLDLLMCVMAENEAFAADPEVTQIAMACKQFQVGLINMSSHLQDDGQLMEVLELNELLQENILKYEDAAMVNQSERGTLPAEHEAHYSPPGHQPANTISPPKAEVSSMMMESSSTTNTMSALPGPESDSDDDEPLIKFDDKTTPSQEPVHLAAQAAQMKNRLRGNPGLDAAQGGDWGAMKPRDQPPPSADDLLGGFGSLAVEPSASQNQALLQNLLQSNAGLLHQDDDIKIDVMSGFMETEGRLQLTIANRGTVAMSGLDLTLNPLDGLAGQSLENDTLAQIQPGESVARRCTFVCQKPFNGFATIQISYRKGDTHKSLSLKLPVVATKYMVPVNLSREQFDADFEGFGATLADSFSASGDIGSTLQAKNVLEKLNLGIADYSIDEIKAVGVMHTTSGAVECYLALQLADALSNVYMLDCRSNEAVVKAALESTLKSVMVNN